MGDPFSSSKRQRLDDKGAFDENLPQSASAYASSSSTQSKLRYDVYINHRGPDVRNTLCKSIYDKLYMMGVQVFFDRHSLNYGVLIPKEIEEAIRNAYVHIAIFSPRYAGSPWCLAELSFMLRTDVKIIPIYYGVNPSDLRWVDKGKGIYVSAFYKHETSGRYTEENLTEWKRALKTVSNINGYELNNYDYVSDLDHIAEEVLKEIGACEEYDIFISHRELDTEDNVPSLIYHRLIHCGLRVFLSKEYTEAEGLPSEIRSVIGRSTAHVAFFSVNYAKSSWCLNELCEMLQSGCEVIAIFYGIKSEDFSRIKNGHDAEFSRFHENKSKDLVKRWTDALGRAANIPGKMEFNTEEGDLGHFVEKVVEKVQRQEGTSVVYDIFINHRGPDTKKTLASLIYHRLVGYGLRVFLDENELRAGYTLTPAIKSAIRSSSVHVAIFSENYVESPWCLNELLDMFQSGGRVIPIFYNVEPADLRHIEKGRHAKKFQALKDKRDENNRLRHRKGLVARWKDALHTASKISGMEFNSNEGNLANFVEDIVEKVQNEAKANWELLHVAEHPVGLSQAAENFDSFLKERQLMGSTTVVGIIGLKGLGKSTFVKHLYNCNLESPKFKRYCFLELNKKDLAALQQKLVRDLLGHDKYSISDTTKGKRKLQTCLKGWGPVLIVLDGVDKEEQIESLLLVAQKNVLAEGSLILVTCHDKDLLKGQVNLFYEVNNLRVKDAHDLFCWYAFHSSSPPEELEDLVDKFLKICCGLPLALKVLGRKLYVDLDQNQRDEQENRRYWEEQLKELSRPKIPKDIVKILKVIYDDLEEEKKEAFLDVAHFLVGEDTDLAVRVLEGLHDISGFLCLKELQSKCLLDLEEVEHCERPFAKGPGIQWRRKGSSKVRMHDLVRKMATQIASEDSFSSPKTKPVRLCQLDNKSILQQLQFRDHVKGIRCEYIDEPERQDPDIKEPQLPEMTDQEIYELRLLVLHNFRVPFPSNRWSQDLIWLRMHKSNWGNTIPSTLSLRNLRVLELDGVNFEALDRKDGDKFPSKLLELTVDYRGEPSSRVDKNCMEASSSASGSVWDWFRFRELKYLVKMVLINVRGLRSLPIDFYALGNLRHLDLSGWTDLDEMPDSFAGLLQLQHLALQDCRSLCISDLGGITKLKYLDFEGCSLLQKLPDKTTAQRELRHLNLRRTSIKELPQDFGELEKLEQLFMSSSYLTTLPDSFHKLDQLRILTLSGCPHLSDISSRISIEHFPYLESLQLWDVKVMTVPQGIAWSRVKVLHVKAPLCGEFSFNRDCNSVKDVSSPLTELRLVETEISKLCIPSEESLFPDFEIVDLSGSQSLTEVQSLPWNLRRLYLMNCPLLTTLPCLSNLASIRILDISGCRNLEVLNLEGLRSIEEIAAKECWRLQSIQGLAQLGTLSYLNVSTFTEDPNSTIWSEILGFPSNVSTVILGGAKVLCMNAEEMDYVKQSILNEVQGAATIDDIPTDDIPTIENVHQVSVGNMELYGAILLCFIARKYFIEFEVVVDGNVYNIHGPNFITREEVHGEHEETHWAYTFMWSKNSDLFKDLKFHGRSVLDCTIKLCDSHSGTLKASFTKAWIVKIRNRTDSVRICKHFLNSLLLHPQASGPPGCGNIKDTTEIILAD